MAVARAWATGSLAGGAAAAEPEAIADARRLGLDSIIIAAVRAELGLGAAGEPPLFAWQLPGVTLFLAGASQWRIGISGSAQGLRTLFIGLDYAGVKIAAETLGLPITPAAWADCCALERAARDLLNGEAVA